MRFLGLRAEQPIAVVFENVSGYLTAAVRHTIDKLWNAHVVATSKEDIVIVDASRGMMCENVTLDRAS
jgi:hypothetical protein